MSTRTQLAELRPHQGFKIPEHVRAEIIETTSGPHLQLAEMVDKLDPTNEPYMRTQTGEELYAGFSVIALLAGNQETDTQNPRIVITPEQIAEQFESDFLESACKGLRHIRQGFKEAERLDGQFFVVATDLAKSFRNNAHIQTNPGEILDTLSSALASAHSLLLSFMTHRNVSGSTRADFDAVKSLDDLSKLTMKATNAPRTGQLALKAVA